MENLLSFTISFEGNDADNNFIDFYDAAQALIGFQRSLALTTHLILNDEIITQAPSLKGARLLCHPPSPGSWKTVAIVSAAVFTGAYQLGTAPKDTPVGHLIYSAYDYVISESLGFHVDYEKSLGQQYKEIKKFDSVPQLDQARFDSLIEKYESSIVSMHRPIAGRHTASTAKILSNCGTGFPVGPELNDQTFDFINYTSRSDDKISLTGKVTSYNKNTYKGRFYCNDIGHPVPFELAESCRNTAYIIKIVTSLTKNAIDSRDQSAEINITVFANQTKSGRVKSFYVIDIA